jgi:peptidoglycan/LPS O-acetylase OafA/YrhL
MKRVLPIEGLRAYLALWVVVCHVLGISGYNPEMLHGLLRLVRQGDLAVDLFIIISGFVIFFLLDEKGESYVAYLTRRFFRLYPLFIVLFLVSIPATLIRSENIVLAERFGLITHQRAEWINTIIKSGWDQFPWHVGLHSVMVHGVVQQKWLPNGPLVEFASMSSPRAS